MVKTSQERLPMPVPRGPYLLGLLLELLDDTLVDAAAFVDEMTGGGRLARVDVANDDDVDVRLFFAHFFSVFGKCFYQKEKDLSYLHKKR